MNTALEPSKTLGPFELLKVLGRGATATVYKARHQPTGRIVAAKVGTRFMALEPAALERFEREFTAISPFRHPNLVRVLALGKEKGVPYLVLEFVPGESLEQRLKLQGPLGLEEAISIFLQVAEGLRYLHANRFLHRDIKPGNILLDQHHAKLADFGLLKQLADDTQLTRSRRGMGTMEYGAPEQFEDAKRVDRRCDLYSLAATLYTALTGKFPFGNGGQLQIMQRKLLYQFVPLRLLLPSLDPAIDALVNRCLHACPDQRPGSCDEFIAVLRGGKTGLASVTPRAGEADVPRAKPGGTERRATPRFAVDLTASFVPFHQKTRGRWEATILDLSPTGVCLQTPRPLAVHSVLQLTLGKRVTSELALVRWVKPGTGQTQIAGCQFVRPLTSPEFEVIYRTGARPTTAGSGDPLPSPPGLIPTRLDLASHCPSSSGSGGPVDPLRETCSAQTLGQLTPLESTVLLPPSRPDVKECRDR